MKMSLRQYVKLTHRFLADLLSSSETGAKNVQVDYKEIAWLFENSEIWACSPRCEGFSRENGSPKFDLQPQSTELAPNVQNRDLRAKCAPVTSPIYRTRSYTEGSTKKKGNAKRAGISRDGTWPQVAPLFACGYIHLFVLQNDDKRGSRHSLEPLVCFFFFSCFFYILLMYLHSIGDFFEIQPRRRQGEKGE